MNFELNLNSTRAKRARYQVRLKGKLLEAVAGFIFILSLFSGLGLVISYSELGWL